MILLNPEFHRNIWLKFSPFRIVAMPILLGILFFASVNFDGAWAEEISAICITIYYITIIFWGTYESSLSFQDEVRNSTWDFQKMSQATPWQLTVGKLLGATSYTWYFGLTVILIYGFCQNAAGKPYALYGTACLILAGLMGHAASTLISALQISKAMEKATGALRKNITNIISFIAGYVVAQGALSASHLDMFSGKQTPIEGFISWYGHIFEKQTFILYSLCFFLFWLVMGAYRVIREELLYKVTPTYWAIFICTFILYACGLDDRFDSTQERMLFAYFFTLVLTYFTAIMESADMARYQRFLGAYKARHIRSTLINTPKWIASAVILVVVYLAQVIDSGMHASATAFAEKFTFITTAALFMARDILFIHFSLHIFRIRHMRFAMLFFYLMAYWLIPLLHAKIIGVDISSLLEKLVTIRAWYYPAEHISIAAGITPVTLQIVGLCLLAFYVKNKRAPAAPA